MTLTWTVAPGGEIYTFVVRGGLRGTTPISLATTRFDVRTWTSELLPAGSYAMDVVARGSFNGDGPPSNRIEFSVDVSTPPLAPTDLSASTGDTTVALEWNPAATGPAPGSYILEAAAAGSTAFSPVATAGEPRFFATGVPGGDWQVRVRSVTAGGVSNPSNIVSLKTTPCTAPPLPPLSLTVMPVVAIPSLRWLQPASGPAEQYVIEAGPTTGSSSFGRFAVPGAAQTYEPTVPGGTFYVRVRARNACGDSAPSNEVIAVSFATP